MLLFRAMFFVINKDKKAQENRDIYSCFVSIPVEIHRLAPFTVNLSLHISFLSPEMCAQNNLIPMGIGILDPSSHGSSGPVPCGGIMEFFSTILSLEEVTQDSE